jgi:hypothetical protein
MRNKILEDEARDFPVRGDDTPPAISTSFGNVFLETGNSFETAANRNDDNYRRSPSLIHIGNSQDPAADLPFQPSGEQQTSSANVFME